ncbi:MAG: putative pyridoxine 5'-phosphate oxidase superfamily flavin-nucleotide-binding protein [Verrucomicrobiales bacterium]|jgi:predicted pyridoxine 5'-phosphate oxidase superfamily flavin-nucleotide-binding protein
MITANIAEFIESSVLCWLATASEEGIPNVSPKEAFLHDGQGRILVANIASPQTVRNIRINKNVCLSFVNVFVQKGYKINGEARILKSGDSRYAEAFAKLASFIGDAFKTVSIIEIDPIKIDQIIAPSYHVFPESTELDRIRESLKTYSVADYQKQAKQPETVQPPTAAGPKN